MAVVNRLEPVELEREDDQLVVLLRSYLAQLFAAVGKSLAIEQPGHAIGRGNQCGARLSLLASFRFMHQVDITAPAEQNQGDIECERNYGHLEVGLEPLPSKAQLLENF